MQVEITSQFILTINTEMGAVMHQFGAIRSLPIVKKKSTKRNGGLQMKYLQYLKYYKLVLKQREGIEV